MSCGIAEELKQRLQDIEQSGTRQELANASAQLVVLMPQLSGEPGLQGLSLIHI